MDAASQSQFCFASGENFSVYQRRIAFAQIADSILLQFLIKKYFNV
jgi:hypothetical protein